MPEQSMRITSRRRLRPVLTWSVVACTALCLLTPRPGYADPGNSTVPDAGAPPVAAAPVQVPGSTTPPAAATPVVGPLGTQIMTESAAVEALGEQLKQAQIDADAAHDATVTTQQAWQLADSTARSLRQRANDAAAEAYKKAESLGPLGAYADKMQQLGVLAPGFTDGTPGGVAGSHTAAQDAARAEMQAERAHTVYTSALATEQDKDRQRDSLAASYAKRSSALSTLKANNTQAVAQAEAAQEATDQRLAGSFAAGTNVDGARANPIALAAVRYALRQLGADYHFGKEGPYRTGYDCSGLTWAAYRSAGVNIPRVAKDQYHGTTPVDVTRLLPGDLVFFSTVSTSDWRTISHVGMYLGDNKMVEAPHTGDVVKIATVWWSAFYGATRVVPALPPPTPPPPPPPTSPTPSPSPTPSRSPSPAPSAPNHPPPPSVSHPPGPSTGPSSTPAPASSTPVSGGSNPPADSGGNTPAPSQSPPTSSGPSAVASTPGTPRSSGASASASTAAG
jgi:peptidoglycan DL-endopeptidase CwlO